MSIRKRSAAAATSPARVKTLPTETLAAWVPNFEAKFASMDDWLAMFSRITAQAAAAGAELFLLPEYLSECWLSWCPKARFKPSTDAFLAEQATIAYAHMAKLAKQHKMMIVGGTAILTDKQGKRRNRCTVITPDGKIGFQDKMAMMPDERDRKAGPLTSGEGVRLFNWKGYKVAVVICLDIQIPRLALTMLEQGHPDLIVIPSMTTYRSGFTRVFSGAAARSIELHCPVLVTGGVGTITARGEAEPNTSGAGIFLPCEAQYGYTGRREVIGPFEHLYLAEGELFVAKNVPIANCKADRQLGRCEAWHPSNHTRKLKVLT